MYGLVNSYLVVSYKNVYIYRSVSESTPSGQINNNGQPKIKYNRQLRIMREIVTIYKMSINANHIV